MILKKHLNKKFLAASMIGMTQITAASAQSVIVPESAGWKVCVKKLTQKVILSIPEFKDLKVTEITDHTSFGTKRGYQAIDAAGNQFHGIVNVKIKGKFRDLVIATRSGSQKVLKCEYNCNEIANVLYAEDCITIKNVDDSLLYLKEQPEKPVIRDE